MGGQIIDATIVAAPKQRNSDGEKREIKEGRIPAMGDRSRPSCGRRTATHAGRSNTPRPSPSEDGAPRVDLAVPAFGYKNHVGIDRRHRLIRSWAATDASRHDGALLPALIDKDNTASDVWADTAYRSKANEKSSPGGSCARRSTARSPRASPCPGVPPAPMAANPRCARRSSTSSPARRARWACISAPYNTVSQATSQSLSRGLVPA